MTRRLLAGLLPLLLASAPIAAQQSAVDVTVLAINDFHGNLLPPDGGIKLPDPNDPAQTVRVAAGGSEAMATLVHQLRAAGQNSIFVSAGDNIGASPLLSGILHDEPTIESLSLMGLEASAVGNHEFDDGIVELLRMQNGGCHPDEPCDPAKTFRGAKFRYLAASTIDEATGKPILPPYYVKSFEGVPVAFIGLTLKETPGIVMPSGVAGLRFEDEAATVNALVPELQKQGIQAIVVLIHQGGFPTGGINECPKIAGPIGDIVKKFDKAVDVVISGHTHKAYNCEIDGRLVTSADKFGTLVTDIHLQLDRKSHDIVSARAENLVVRTDTYAKDPEQTALIAHYQEVVAPMADRVVGKLSESLTEDATPAGETTLGDVIADAQLAITAPADASGAEIAFTNPGGVRTDLLKKNADGTVTYADLFAVQPFGNQLVTLDLTGAQIERMLEQQWLDQPKPRILHVSRGFAYRWDGTKPPGDRVDFTGLTLNSQPVDPAATYRVTVNNFLADGGDGFAVLRDGVNRVTGPADVDALAAYFGKADVVVPGPAGRIGRVDAPG